MRAPVALALSSAVLVLGGCGAEKIARPSLEPEPAARTKQLDYPAAGLSFELPRDVEVQRTKPPGVVRGRFGEAVISVFAYPRREQLPRDERELKQARERLGMAAEERAPGYRLRDARTTEVAGASAVELVGDQTISSGGLRIRSLHVYEGRAEYVIELLAPRADFARFDRAIFPTIERTLEVTGEVRAPRR